MSNTRIQLKKSGLTGNTPADLNYGEVAINYADGKLFYKNGIGIKSIENQDTFSTINVNSSLILATSPTDILNLVAGNNVTLSACTVSKTITINSVSDDIDQYSRDKANGAFDKANNALANTNGAIFGGELNITGTLKALAQGGDEGGEIQLGTAATGSTLTPGTVTIDIYQNQLRFFESGGTNRGAYIDLSAANTGVGSNLLTGGGGGTTDTAARNSASAAFERANASFIQANAAFSQANSGNNLATSAYNQANAATNSATFAYDRANAAYTQANSTNTYAFSAYSAANTASSNTIILQGVDVTQNTNITAADNLARGAYNQANAATDSATAAYGQANAANNLATSGYAQANAATNSATAAYERANAAFTQANTVPTQLQIAGIRTNASYHPLFVDSNNAVLTAESVYSTGGGITLNPSTNTITATTFSGTLVSVSAGSFTQYVDLTGDNDYVEWGAGNDVRMLYNGVANTINLELYSDVVSFKIADVANTADRFIFYKANGDLRLVSGNVIFSDGTVQRTDASTPARNAYTHANASFDQANAATNSATAAYGQANAATNSASAAYERANASFTQANVGATFVSSGGTVSGNVNITKDLSVTGNLYVLGNTVSINTSSFTVQDSMIVLGLGNYTTDILDIGFAGHYNAGTNAHTGIIRDSTTKEYYVFQGYTPELDTTNNINIADPSFATANINADYFKGNLIATTAVINGYNIFNYSSAAYSQANAATNSATAAYTQANAATNSATFAYGRANSSYTQANAATNSASAAFERANAAFTEANGAVQTGFTTISANSVSITPASNADTLTITAGNNISISACTTTKTITISSTASGGGGGGGTVTFNVAPPVTGNSIGDIWIDSNDGTEYRYVSDGNSSQWVDFTSSATVSSIAGGSANAIVYQTAVGNTGFTSVGTQGQLLTAGIGGVPIWTAQSSLSIANTQITGTFSVSNTNITGLITATQLANTTVTPGTYGGTTSIPVIVIDQQGRITSAANTSITPGGFSLTGTSGSGSVAGAGTLSFAGSNGFTAVVSSNTVTLSDAQDLRTSANPQFNSLGIGTAPSGVLGEIRAANNITAYYSDKRLKTNIRPIDDALGKLSNISGVYYTANDVAEKYGYTDKSEQVGVIAQEVQKILPHVVKPAPFDTDYDEDKNQFSKSGENYLTVQYEKLIPLLIECIKEQQTQIDSLRDNINTMLFKNGEPK